ncbi:MAG: D-alanyl-D-alanine carboxypeptidase family protein [Sandaracinaceae bacterium]
MHAPARGGLPLLVLTSALLAVGLGLGALPSADPAVAQPLDGPCSRLVRPDRRGRFLARPDLVRPASEIDGDDLLALVNRTPSGGLPPDYAPDDLVDLETGEPAAAASCVPPRRMCLRRRAADAYRELREAMRAAGFRPFLSSAYRGFRVQCATFLRWARRSDFCDAATASALPGHSQHQLGTAIDLFDRGWNDRGRFRRGFGCTPAGRWIAAHAHEHGFVLPYPLHPDHRDPDRPCTGDEDRLDPRTGYRFEPWHLRFIGRAPARAFRAAVEASGAGSLTEITLEQWLRSRDGARDPVGPPVCDGCNCGRCATFGQASDRSPCRAPALRIDENGQPRAPAGTPRLVDVELDRRDDGALHLVARVEIPANTLTLPPVVTERSGGRFVVGQPGVQLPERVERAFPPQAGAWRLGIGLDEGDALPWTAALVRPRRDGTANGVLARMPAAPGTLEVRVPIDGVRAGRTLRVGLVSDARVVGARRLVAP